MRAKHIKRKKKIAESCYGWGWYYSHDGMYSKGKVHCSCGMCSAKTRNKSYSRKHLHANYSPAINYKHSDLLKVQSMDDDLKEFLKSA